MPTISLGQALRNAIESEKAANSFYSLLAESTADREATSFLESMAKEEALHAKQIEELAKKTLPDITIANLPDDNTELVETMPGWADTDDIDVAHALQVALDAENYAALYYDTLADSFEPGPSQELFRTISKTEEKHAENLRKMMK